MAIFLEFIISFIIIILITRLFKVKSRKKVATVLIIVELLLMISIPKTLAEVTPVKALIGNYKSPTIKASSQIPAGVLKEKKEVKPVAPVKDNRQGVIYLTFDDGPSLSITPKILDILKKKNVKATFFILNYDGKKEEIVKREVNEGHTVAIHGYSHDYKEIYQSEEIYMQNIKKLQDKIKASTGYNATITRFPGGSSNTVSRYNPGIMTRLTKKVVDSGYKYFDWNVTSGDAGEARNSTDVYNNVVKNLSKSKSNVVLMHDFNGNTKTLNALESIIDYGIQNGYTFSKITESTKMVTHSVNN